MMVCLKPNIGALQAANAIQLGAYKNNCKHNANIGLYSVDRVKYIGSQKELLR